MEMMETTTTETAETTERKTETIHFFHLPTANSIYTISLREEVAVRFPISSNFG
jgi:Tfp pilus assembly major pilin PilA